VEVAKDGGLKNESACTFPSVVLASYLTLLTQFIMSTQNTHFTTEIYIGWIEREREREREGERDRERESTGNALLSTTLCSYPVFALGLSHTFKSLNHECVICACELLRAMHGYTFTICQTICF
jgi:hypothetical protein